MLERGATVVGRARGADDRPATGALVAALPLLPRPERWELWRIASTDAEGSFRLEGVLPGRVELLLVDPRTAFVLAREEVEIAAGEPFGWSPRHDATRLADQHHPLRYLLRWRLRPDEHLTAPSLPLPGGARDE